MHTETSAADVAQAWNELVVTAMELWHTPGFIPFLVVVCIVAIAAQIIMVRRNKANRKPEIPEQYRLK